MLLAVFDFLLAIISDSWATMCTLLSIGSIMLVVTGHSGNLPVSGLWIVGYVALLIAAARIWYKEYRQPGPNIDLEYLHQPGRDDEVHLMNRGKEDAFDVRVQDISMGNHGFVSFQPVKVKRGDTVSVTPIVHQTPEGSLLFSGKLRSFILETAVIASLDELVQGIAVPFSIHYKSVHNQWYKSNFSVVFLPGRNDVKVDFISYRRLFKPFLTFPRLSTHGR